MNKPSLVLTAAAAAVLLSLQFSSAPAQAAVPTTKPTKPAATKSKKAAPAPPAVSGRGGNLTYNPDAQGNRVPDFSYSGYAAGEKPIPNVAAAVVVGAPDGDSTRVIQTAIDQVSKLPLDDKGFRGAVLIPPGEYKIDGSLTIAASGVVLRGSGPGDGGTKLLATGIRRRNVVQIKGEDRPAAGDAANVTDSYVPVGSSQITVDNGSSFKAGDSVIVTRPSTSDWIVDINMDDLGGDRNGPSWHAGSRDIVFDRVIKKVEGNTLTLDAPLTIALDANYGGGTVAKSDWPNRVTNAGVENLHIVSSYDEKNPKDEEHAWYGVGLYNARDAWVRQVTCENLVGSAVAAWESTSRVTVEDVKNLHPVGEVGGLRRYSFFTDGQQVLMQRLYSEEGFHDFAIGIDAPGPNAFVQCESVGSLGESGAIDSAACGSLFDRIKIDGQPLSLRNRTYQGQGVGWASFNGVIWNSTAPLISLWKPPTAQNWAFGSSGEFEGNGAYSGSNDDVNPDSLYYGQLAARIGREAAEKRAELNLPGVQGSRAPGLEDTAKIIEISKKPRVTMSGWIDQAAQRDPIPVSADGVPKADAPVPPAADQLSALPKKISITNGWLTINGKLLTGRQLNTPWWNGSVRPGEYQKATPALTRFVPGRTGTGLTDDLNEVAQNMLQRGQVSFVQFPPLWYERRRDDHERVQRIDGDVVAPFYETPWARSGVMRASDGLSKFDVTKPDLWYFSRLNQFADLATQNGFVLFSGMYQQHNILEAGAHYFDAPWRPRNNVNPVGIPEPVFFAGDKLIYVAEQFYDTTNPDRANLHRTNIRNQLNELADKPNVIFFLCAEYTGPLSFTQFWLDTIAEWEKETGKHPLIALYAPKNVTDGILSDTKRAAVVSLIYNSYDEGDAGWWYQSDGNLYAPEGGKNLAPRQWIRLLHPKSAGFEQVYQAVSEYRTKYPDKPFVYFGSEQLQWAALMGGGSIPAVQLDPKLAEVIPTMKPLPPKDGVYVLANEGRDYLVCGKSAGGKDAGLNEAEYESHPVEARGATIVWLHHK